MKMVKVRRVGHSDVVTVPAEVEFRSKSVLIEKLETGQLLVTPIEMLRERIAEISAKVVRDNHEALRILQEHDPEEVTYEPGSGHDLPDPDRNKSSRAGFSASGGSN